MSRFTRVLAWAFPPLPRGLVSRIQTPVVGARGSASATGTTPAPVTWTPAGAGQTTVAPSAPGDGGRGPGADTLRPGSDQTPEGEGGSPADPKRWGSEPSPGRPSPSGPVPRRSSDQLAVDLITWRTPS